MSSRGKKLMKSVPSNPLSTSNFIIPLSVVVSGKKQLDRLIKKENMTKHKTVPNDFLFRNDLKDASKKAYRRHWIESRNFFFLIGDYQSALLCDREKCPKNLIPFFTTGLVLYLNFRCGIKGTILLDPNTSKPKLTF